MSLGSWARSGGGVIGAAVLTWGVYQGLTWDLREASADAGGFRRVAVERGDLLEAVSATGRLEPRARVVVQSEIPGIVAQVHVDDGDRVTRGAPLVELDRERLEDRVAELAAALARARALARVDLVGEADAQRGKQRRDHARAERLFEGGALSRESLDAQRHALDLAELALRNAAAERDARRAAVDEAENAHRRALRDLEKSIIRSPIDGVVVRRVVEVGSAVADLQNGGTVTLELADDQRIHLLAEVDENDVAAVRLNQPADVTIDAFPGEDFTGTVRKVSFSGREQRGVSIFEVEIELVEDPRVRVGMSADARIRVTRHEDVLLIPNASILRSDTGPQVRLARPDSDDGFEVVAIEERYSDGFRTAVSGGIAAGDAVLVRAEVGD